jgi:glycosyltransferase involved in cell wall biosynthesis
MTKKENNKNQKDTTPIINSNNLEPLVSVLIPCFNAGEYIAETLDSVIAQTYTNWECIVVDDHSTDNSIEIIEQYRQQYPTKIRLYTNPRKGACAARNVAFEKSNGEFIQYLDADDLLSSNKIEQQIKLFQKHGKNIITNCRWGRFKGEPSNVKWEYQKIDHDYENPLDWLVDSWNGKGMAQTAVWLTARKKIEKAGPWNEELKTEVSHFCKP